MSMDDHETMDDYGDRADLEADVEREFLEEHGQVYNLDKPDAQGELILLRVALKNEKAAPELLRFESDLVDKIKDLLKEQSAKVDQVRGGARGKALLQMIYQMDHDRARYMLHEYLRVRLKKIQRFGLHIFQYEEEKEKLSPSELVFADQFVQLDENHLKRLVLDKLPKVFQGYTDDYGEMGNMVTEPNLDQFVFCRPQVDIGNVQVEDDDMLDQDIQEEGGAVEFMEGDLIAVRYSKIRQLVVSGDVALE